MTASAGLHNMPAILRQAVIADDGHLFVRADLGQVEPRVLAAVSGDRALIAATEAEDLYLPVAAQLGVDRPTAKVAMIAAMYGQTTGHGGEAARRMRAAYPVAMAYLDDADRRARSGQDLRTCGGRLVRMSGGKAASGNGHPESSARAAARGRYGRNAMIQGAAAELFKMWAVTVRARAASHGARIGACMTSCSCTCRRVRQRRRPRWSATAFRRRRGAGPPVTPAPAGPASSRTSRRSAAGPTRSTISRGGLRPPLRSPESQFQDPGGAGPAAPPALVQFRARPR
jgi:hypothetical protein